MTNFHIYQIMKHCKNCSFNYKFYLNLQIHKNQHQTTHPKAKAGAFHLHNTRPAKKAESTLRCQQRAFYEECIQRPSFSTFRSLSQLCSAKFIVVLSAADDVDDVQNAGSEKLGI